MTLGPPDPHPFLEAEHGAVSPDAAAIILGLAADGGVSFRQGAVEGPSGIRRFSESIESYSPRARSDLKDLRIIDAGDHDERSTVEKVVGGILDEAWPASSEPGQRPLLVSIGGDHSVTPPAVRAVAARVPDLAVIGFDAHMDMREDYEGDHACTYRRTSDAGLDTYVFGLRSGERSEWEDAPKVLRYFSTGLDVERAIDEIAARNVYVTFDIDVINPAEAPGTGNPEPGGPSFVEALAALESLAALNVVAFDVVEVSPPIDTSGITQAAAAVLVREALLRFAPRS